MNNQTYLSFTRKLRRNRNSGQSTREGQRETRFINLCLNDRASEIYNALLTHRYRVVDALMHFV